MQFGGWQKISLIDFPGHIATIVFTQGCPLRCRFCHNPSLVCPDQFEQKISEEEILQFLKARKGKLDGIVISGGEPTIHKNLLPFMHKVRSLGFAIKLDTNGIYPDVIRHVIQENLVDYIAMDIKSSLEQYQAITDSTCSICSIQSSISTILTSTVAYEFRSTIVPSLHPFEEVYRMASLIQGAKLYILQQFRSETTIDSSLRNEMPYPDEMMDRLCLHVTPLVQKCIWR